MKSRLTLLAVSLSLMFASAAHAEPLSAPAPSAATLMAQMDNQANYGPAHSVSIQQRHPGVDHTQVLHVQHTFNNLRIWGSEAVLVLDAANSLKSQTTVDRRQGLVANRPSLAGALAGSLSTTPALSSGAAIARVLHGFGPVARIEHYPASAELIIFPLLKNVRVAGAEGKTLAQLNAFDLEQQVVGYELAYLVQTRMSVGGKLAYHDSIISANDGRMLGQWSAAHTASGIGYSQYSGVVPLETSYAGGMYKMLDTTRGVGGAFGGLAVINEDSAGKPVGQLYSNSSNVWGDGKNYVGGGSNSVNGQTAAVDAMWALRTSYDLLKNTQHWLGINGKNGATHVGVHGVSSYPNAWFDSACGCVHVTDNAAGSKQLASISLMGHELSHGLTAATANLTYVGESGALNEAASDIFGQMAQAYASSGAGGSLLPNSGNSWLIGQELSSSNTPLRWMYKPSKDGISPDAWSASLANMDVHYGSGPANRMFYFLAQGSSSKSGSDTYSPYLTRTPLAMVGIGSDKAYRIWFRALTTKMTTNSNYVAAQKAMVAAATELYGATSREVIAVKRAFAAINVGKDVAGG
jgi:Zn-dependent metalloprotease